MKVVANDSFTSVESGFASTKIIAENVLDFIVFKWLIDVNRVEDIVFFARWAEGLFSKNKFPFSFAGLKVHRWIAHGRGWKLLLLGGDEFTESL